MLDSKIVMNKKPSRAYRRMSIEMYPNSLVELKNRSARDNIYSTAESIVLQDNAAAPTETDKKLSIQASLHTITQLNSQVLSPSSSMGHGLMLNRKLTKGYSKFLDEKEFIHRREEEKIKVQKDLKRSMKNENQKIISSDVKKLIISTIVNKKKPRTRSRKANSISENDPLNKHEEKHKQVCSRILGEAYENNLLFVKTHEDRSLITENSKVHTGSQTPNLRAMIKFNEFSNSDLKKGVKKLLFTNNERKLNRAPSGDLSSMYSLTKGRYKENERPKLSILQDSENRFPTLTLGKGELGKEVEDIATLSDMLKNNQGVFSQHKLGNNTLEVNKPSDDGLKHPKKFLNDLNIQSHRDLRLRTNSRRNVDGNRDLFTANHHSEKKILFQNARRGRKYQLSIQDNIETRSRTSGAVQSFTTLNDKDSISKINELCQGAIKSTSNLSLRMRQQHDRTGKELSRLGTRIEKLTFENTIENWENSVKQIFGPLSIKFQN